MKILVLEDDPSIAEMLKFNLERRGHEVVVYIGVVSGQSLGKILKFWRAKEQIVEVDLMSFDMAFIDGNMYDNVLGTELVELFKELGVVSIGNTNNDNLKSEFVQRGADFVCVKTAVVSWLKTGLQDAIALRMARFAAG